MEIGQKVVLKKDRYVIVFDDEDEIGRYCDMPRFFSHHWMGTSAEGTITDIKTYTDENDKDWSWYKIQTKKNLFVSKRDKIIMGRCWITSEKGIENG